MSAYEAIENRKSIHDELLIQPADTWKQPDYVPKEFSASNKQISLNQLNEDCLMAIFRRLSFNTLVNLSLVCERFKEIIQRNMTTIHKMVSITIDSDNAVFVRNAFSLLKHVKHVRLISDNRKPFQSNLSRLMDIFARNINGNIETLELNDIYITKRMQVQLKPKLMHLNKLKWMYTNNYEGDENLIDLCPNLKKIYIRMCHKTDFPLTTDKWQTLESCTLNIPHMIQTDALRRFMANNNQINSFKMNITHQTSILNELHKHLTNVTKLKLYCYQTINFEPLIHLKQLKCLRIANIDDYNYDRVLNIVGELNHLEKLELNWDVDFVEDDDYVCNDIIEIGKKLKNLKEIYLGGFILNVDLILNFLEVTPKLQIFRFSEGGVRIRNELIEDIINLRLSQSKENKTDVIPLNIFTDSKFPKNQKPNQIVQVCPIDVNTYEFTRM